MMKMDCNKIEENLLEYIYDEINEELKLKIKTHLNECRNCREKEKFYKKVIENTQKIKIDLPDDIWRLQIHQIKKKIKEEKNFLVRIKDSVLDFINIKKVALAGLLILFFIGGIYFFKINQEQIKYEEIIENMEILENISIIEQIDFYTKLKEGDFDL